MENFELPATGVVFWPVGRGDSTTVVVKEGLVMQVDLHHLERADDESDPHCAIVDKLIEVLPQRDKRPYLNVFALTHPDTDHCKGFDYLLSNVTIGELWFSPRIFREFEPDMHADAQAFRAEAHRRIEKIGALKGQPPVAGDRIRIIGWDELLTEEHYSDLPNNCFSFPGQTVTILDGEDVSQNFKAFIHGPFKDDAEGDRNNTSLAMQLTLKRDGGTGKILLFGDHCYPVVNRIFQLSSVENLAWNILLAPHHCSKSVLHYRTEPDGEEELQSHLVDAIESAAENTSYIVASCSPIPAVDEPGNNPPHAIAKERYQEIGNSGFICTHEHPDEDMPVPVVFTVDARGLSYRQPLKAEELDGQSRFSIAIGNTRGSNSAPTQQVGHGNE